MKFTLISLPPDFPADGTRLEAVLSETAAGYSPRVLHELPAGEDLRGQRLLFAVQHIADPFENKVSQACIDVRSLL